MLRVTEKLGGGWERDYIQHVCIMCVSCVSCVSCVCDVCVVCVMCVTCVVCVMCVMYIEVENNIAFDGNSLHCFVRGDR